MADVVYNSFWDDVIRGLLDVDGSTFRVLLTTSAYTENKDTHLVRSSVTNELPTAAGYTAGGALATVTVTKDTANDRIDISLGGTVWTTGAGETLTARKVVYYQVVGSAATDRLVACLDYVTDQTASNGGTLTLTASTLRLTNT